MAWPILPILRLRAVLLLLAAATAPALAQPSPPRAQPPRPTPSNLPRGFHEQETLYYTVYTDLPPEQFRAIELRLNRLAEEYQRRTQAFSAVRNDRKFPFYLFSNKEDYQRFAPLPGSAGVFDGRRLLACAEDAHDSRTWRVIQHEAFHQYAMMRLDGEKLPIWINEGLADYFGESLFTGDGFVSGLMPEYRLQRLRKAIAERDALTLGDLIALSHDEWNKQLRGGNYDLAWALTQFLAHGDDGKYQAALVRYIREASRGGDAHTVFQQCIGPIARVEARFRDWLHELPDNPTRERYGEVAVAIVTSFVARAAAQRQPIADIAELQQLVADKALRCPEADWLPVQLLTEFLPAAPRIGRWTFDPGRRGPPSVTLRLGDEWELRGMYSVNRGRVLRVWVETRKLGEPARR
jgi:hypothetical protein